MPHQFRSATVLFCAAATATWSACAADDPPAAVADAGEDPTPLRAFGEVLIPAGEFLMGEPVQQYICAEPPVQVRITRPFYMQQTEVRIAEFYQLVEFVNGYETRWGCASDRVEECSVTGVSWYGALEYANRLSLSRGLEPCYKLTNCEGVVDGAYACDVPSWSLDCEGYRLPTVAEWEYAARAGVTTTWPCGNGDGRGSTPPDSGCPDNWAWTIRSTWEFIDSSGIWADIFPPGLKWPNDWGLYDMLGNTPEWVWDTPYHHDGGLQVDPIFDENLPTYLYDDLPGAERRLVRGGGVWDVAAGNAFSDACVQSSARFGGKDLYKWQTVSTHAGGRQFEIRVPELENPVGFRLVRTAASHRGTGVDAGSEGDAGGDAGE